MRTRRTCQLDGCDRLHSAKGYCDRHYQQLCRPKTPQFYRSAMRMRAIVKLGGRCVCCGETELAFLVIDHIDGGGTRARGAYAYAEIRRIHDDPANSGCQVLCANCNMAKERKEGCPHRAQLGNTEAAWAADGAE